MTLRPRSLAGLMAAPLLVVTVFACGEEGQTIGEGQCSKSGETLPLYQWVFTDAGGWVRIDPNGKKVGDPVLTAPPYGDLPNNGRCQTPPGYMVSVDQGTGGAKATGTGGAKATGGAKNQDAGKD